MDRVIELHLYAVGNGTEVVWDVVTNTQNTARIEIADTLGNYHIFAARATHLQQWCSNRMLEYQHQILQIPVNFEGL